MLREMNAKRAEADDWEGRGYPELASIARAEAARIQALIDANKKAKSTR